MTRDTLNTQIWKACNIHRQDDNTNSLLDYVGNRESGSHFE